MGEKEGDIRRGVDLYLYYWVIPFFVIFVLINNYVKVFDLGELNIGLMISVVSFLFGFLITISFSMILSRVSLLKESLAGETGRLMSLFSLSTHLGDKFHEMMREKIDEYTVITLRDYKNYENARPVVYSIFDNLNLMECKTTQQKAFADSFLYILGEFEPLRENLEYLTQGKLLPAMKIANYILAFILVGLLFLGRGNPFANALFVILSTTIIFILLIIEDYENLKLGDYVVNISNSEQLFDLIGKARYYPRPILNRVHLEEGKSYRIGFYDEKAKQEKIYTIVYNSYFSQKLNSLINKFRRKNSAVQ